MAPLQKRKYTGGKSGTRREKMLDSVANRRGWSCYSEMNPCRVGRQRLLLDRDLKRAELQIPVCKPVLSTVRNSDGPRLSCNEHRPPYDGRLNGYIRHWLRLTQLPNRKRGLARIPRDFIVRRRYSRWLFAVWCVALVFAFRYLRRIPPRWRGRRFAHRFQIYSAFIYIYTKLDWDWTLLLFTSFTRKLQNVYCSRYFIHPVWHRLRVPPITCVDFY